MPCTGKKIKQLKRIASVEGRWSTLAAQEGRGNLKTARYMRKTGKHLLADFYYKEAVADFAWAKKRRAVANAAKATVKRLGR